MAAAYALAELTKQDVPDYVKKIYNEENLVFGRNYFIPKPLDKRLISYVSPAVAKAAMDSGVARKPIKNWDKYKRIKCTIRKNFKK